MGRPGIENRRRGWGGAFACALGIALAVVPPAAANPASLDPSFGTDGRVHENFGEPDVFHVMQDSAVLPGGQIVTAGSTDLPDDNKGSSAIVAKFDADGGLDSSFAGDGRFEFAPFAPAPSDATFAMVVTIDRAGRVVFAVEIHEGVGFPKLVVVRLDKEGEIDPTFSGDGIAEVDFGGGYITSLATYPDGSVVVAGSGQPGFFDTVRFTAARLTPSGDPDLTFSENGRQMLDVHTDPEESVEDVALGRDGEVVLAGWTRDRQGGGTAGVVRLHYDGSLDQSFSGDGVTTMGGARADGAHGLALLPDGKVVLAGRVDFLFTALRLTSGGVLDKTFSGDGQTTVRFPGEGVTNRVEDVVIRRGGGLVLGGTRAQYGDDSLAFVALRAGGSLDPTFSGDGRALIEVPEYLNPAWDTTMARDGDGRIVAAGTIKGLFDPTTIPTEHFLIRLRGDTSPPRRAKCFGRQPTFLGSPGPDEVEGTPGRDVIITFGGRDAIRGGGGNDLVCSGAGRDEVLLGSGRDRAYGADGPDQVSGGPGDDVLRGGRGRDWLRGGPGKDRLAGGPGRDRISPN